MAKKKSILIVDDELGARESLKMILNSDYDITTADSYDQALLHLSKNSYNLILLDISMTGKNGLDLLKEIRARGWNVAVVMVTATKTLKTAVEAMKYGAKDYITKPYNVEEIYAVITETLAGLEEAKQNASFVFSPKNIIGYNTTLKSIFRLIERLSSTDSTVLILGESGTGKELIAQAIHAFSTRSSKPFIPLHLGALPETLIESELFGHVKGAFTGADKDRKGALELASEGTLFMDEIAEIKESLQVKLLRLLQEKEYRVVGDTTLRKTDARVITATNQDLYQLVQQGKFRADLYYRVNVVPIKLPPLRERLADLPDLIQHLLKKICGRLGVLIPTIESSVMYSFSQYDWPGNIRELENTLERMVLMNEEDILTERDIPLNIFGNGHRNGREQQPPSKDLLENSKTNMLHTLERDAIQLALQQNNGILTSTAKYLGTTRRILKYKMDKLGIVKAEIFQN
jgi:DNA-binding NtrC family response regulator